MQCRKTFFLSVVPILKRETAKMLKKGYSALL